MRNRFVFVKIALLALILFLGACGDPAQNSHSTDSVQKNPEETADAGQKKETLGVERQDFAGYEFKALRPTTLGGRDEDEVTSEEETGDPINDAIYKRTRMAEEHLNVKIGSVTAAGVGTIEMTNHVKKIVQSGSAEFDALVDMLYTQVRLVQEGMLTNFYIVPNIDLGKSWWDQRLIMDTSFENKKLYYLCGDINYWDDYGVGVTYFNKRLFAENGLDYPYEAVRRGKWTFDEFAKLTKGFTKDINGDGKLDENDQWGMLENIGAVTKFVAGFGEKIVTLDDNGIPYLRSMDEAHINAVELLGAFFSDRNAVLLAGSSQIKAGDPYAAIREVFKNGRGLMFYEMIGVIPNLRDMEDDFGLLPLPKRDENQKEYYNFISWGWATAYCIPITNDNLARTGAILETMAAYSVDTLTPALIDVSLKSKFARDEESAEMLELIFRTKSYDIGLDYDIGGLYGVYCDVSMNGAGKFVSAIEKKMPAAQKAIDKLIAKIAELP